jgi:signal-transduction protein with cAMP-binding, CBS, and nucleotidyltransferase domain
MEKITNILSKKQPHFHTVSPQTSLSDALNQMCCENVEYLVVIDEEDRYMGLISEHEIASKVIAANKSLTKTKVKETMNLRLPFATTEDTVEKCMRLLQQHHVRYLPVFEGFQFWGIVSSEDILEEAVNNRMEIFDAEIGKTGRFGVLT